MRDLAVRLRCGERDPAGQPSVRCRPIRNGGGGSIQADGVLVRARGQLQEREERCGWQLLGDVCHGMGING
jgi:hypothetical protein